MCTVIKYFPALRNPTPNKDPVDFRKITKDTHHYLDIQDDGFKPGVDPKGKNMKFWRDLINKNEYIWNCKHNKEEIME